MWRVQYLLAGSGTAAWARVRYAGTDSIYRFVNNFIGPLIVMRSVERYTFPLALRSVQSPVDTEWGALMAGSVVAVLPLLVIFIFSSKKLIAALHQAP